MNSFARMFDDFQWTTMHLMQTSWESGNMRISINDYMKLEKVMKEALQNQKVLLEVYNRTPRRTETYEVSLNDGDGSIRFLPYQKTLLKQMKRDAKILIEDIEDKTQEGLKIEMLEAFVRGTIKSWKEHSGMAMLNQILEERGNPIEMFPE